MKYLILIFISTLCFAKRGNYAAEQTIGQTGMKMFRVKQKCLDQNKGPCFDLTGKNIAYDELKDVNVDGQIVKMIVENSQKKTDYEALIALKLAVRAARIKKIKDGLRDWDTMTVAQKLDALKAMAQLRYK